MRELWIDGTRIADDEPAFVIAELGHNHEGLISKAKAMVVTAKKAGASAVKFQTRVPKEVYSKAEYDRQSDNPQWMAPTYGKHREALEFTQAEWVELFAFCREVGITAFSTPFDFASADMLNDLGVPAFKIASGDATNIPLIEHVASFGKPIIISTGGCTIQDVNRIFDRHFYHNTVPFAFLQCSCVYPCPSEDMNLEVINTYRDLYRNTVIGLSTHNPRYIPTFAAYAVGARIFEHHYTNDRSWKGTDNAFSLTPDMLKDLVDGLAEIRASMGTGIKYPQKVELTPTLERRKKLVARRGILRGAVISREDIAILCPGDGIPPYELWSIVGKVASVDIKADEDLTYGMIVPEPEMAAPVEVWMSKAGRY
jgi:sialic acid synthase